MLRGSRVSLLRICYPLDFSSRKLSSIGITLYFLLPLSVDKGVAYVVVVAKASLLFVDTSPLWMEKFIATIKRHSVLVADTMEHKDYDLRKPEDEVACRA